MILDYTIFGERNSGTNYLRRTFSENLFIPFTQVYGFKHWFIKDFFPRGRANTTTDNECLKSLKFSDHTLFVYIIRNPFDWVGAMYKNPYHIAQTNMSSLYNFLKHPYVSSELNRPKNHDENSLSPWFLDPISNNFFIEESENIITLRNEKNEHFRELGEHVKYFQLIRQENLKEDFQKMIEDFSIDLKHSEKLRFPDYRPPTSYDIDEESRELIRKSLNNKYDSDYYIGKSKSAIDTVE